MDIPEIKPLSDDAPSSTAATTPSDTPFFSFSRKQNYYTTGGRVAGDLAVGAFAPLAAYFVLLIFGFLVIPAQLIAIILCFVFRRHWLAVGLLLNFGVLLLIIILYISLFGLF